MTQANRFTQKQIDIWRQEGAVLLPSYFTAEEMKAVYDDMEALYGHHAKAAAKSESGGAAGLGAKDNVGSFNFNQFTHIEDMPFNCSPALNMLGLHPHLIALAKAALGTEDVHLYQSHSWAKFTGETDYEQPFHCDYKNHTLTVPSDDVTARTINFMIYITDVTEDTGAIAYVPQSESNAITGEDRPMFLDHDAQAQKDLQQLQHRAPGPAGSIFAYGIDVYHRGMNLTKPNAKRYTLTASFKAKGNDMIGWSAWPYHFLKRWDLIMDNATPEQLACLGIPKPGDAFWTERTIRRSKERWPNWDMSAYEKALL